MRKSTWKGAAPIAYEIKTSGSLKKTWKLRWKPVCGSTEIELSRWIRDVPVGVKTPLAFFAAKQSHGQGQRGKFWSSPFGGVWLSAAIPLAFEQESVGLFGLAVSVALANRLQKCSIPVQIKWPNDLLVEQRKIAGFLPRIIYRGQTPTFMCLGVGLNVFNRVPNEGISLIEISDNNNICLAKWSVEVLIAIEKAIVFLNNPSFLCSKAESLLWSTKIYQSGSNKLWTIDGLDQKGQLKVRRGFHKEVWNRWE